MKKSYKYKIKPTKNQQRILLQFFGCCRFIYNWGLDRKINLWKNEQKSVSYIELSKEMTSLKKTEEYKWLNDCSCESLQQSLRCLDNAYTDFFKAKKGFPKFKSKKKSKDVCKFVSRIDFDFENWKVKLPKLGWVKLCKNKTFDIEKVKLGTLTVTKDKCGEYWITIVTDDGKLTISKAKIRKETTVGVDLGIKDFAILSDGTKYGNPKFLEKEQWRLKNLQKRFAKSKKDSKRHERLRLKIARLHRKIKNKRGFFLHNLSSLLSKQYDTICLEDLNVEGMMKNHKLAKSIQSASWSEFVRQITYKTEWNGKNLIFIGRFEPSTKMCSACGYINNDITLNVREWICPECGTHHDRDVNAAINIRDFGLHPQSLVGIEIKIPQINGIKMDGEG